MANPVLKNQIVTLSTPPTVLTAGQQFTVNVGYNVSDANNRLTGIGFGIHFDSTKLQLSSITPSSAPSFFGTAVNPESVNDNNAATNQEISWAYLDFAGNWPNQALPIALGTVTFTALAPLDTSTLNFPVTVNQPAIGYTGPTSLAIAPATSVLNEGNVGLTPFTFTVTRSGDTSVGITAQVDVTGSSANPANASDFGGTFPSQTVTFLAGETSKTVTINVSGDRVVEPNEQFTVTLGDLANATTTNTTFTTTTATGTILDDDTATISLGVNPISVVEDGIPNLVYTFTRTGGDTTTALVVNYNVGGTAALATDYVATGATTFTASTGTVTFAPNATTATVTINPNTDLIFEADETIALTLSTGTGYNIATTTPVTGTIVNDDAVPVLSISSSSIIEGGLVTFAVSHSGDAQAAQSVTVTTSIAGTDTASVNDFTAKTQTIAFAQGETTQNFTVQTTPDSVFEGNETFTATLSAATGGATISGANGTAIGTINNDDAAPVFTIASANAPEGNAIAFTVTRSSDAQAAQSVTVATSITGTDTASVNDFTATTQILSFAQGETSKTFNVQSTQDAVFEGDETFTSTLSAATGGATISGVNNTATGTINNNDAAPVFTIAAAAAMEGNAIAFTVTRTGDAQATQAVSVATSIGATDTASVADFTPSAQVLSFAQGETTKPFTVQTIQDLSPEIDETFTATLTTPTNGATIGTTSTATGTIKDDDSPRISLAIAPASVLEDGVTNLVYTFTRTGLTTSTLPVSYNVSGTTTFGNDYSQTGAATFSASTGTVIFAANSATATVTIDPTADIIFEPDETIALTLVNGSGYNIDTTTPVTGTIANDESAPVFAIASATATEGSPAVFTVTRTGDAQSTQSVTVTTSISATDNVISASDFTTKTETLSFAQGETTKTFSVQTTQDTLFESNETFTATLSAPTNGAIISTTNGTATGTINNDDPAPIFAIASVSATEGGLLNFTVTRTGDAQATQAVTVATSISGSNTTITNDFTAKNETLTFAQGETTKTFSVQSTQDNLFEANETFTATLSAATNGATISSTNGLATGTINNDDPIPNATLSRGNDDVFRLDGSNTAKLKVSFANADSNSVNEIGFFTVDDATGKIGSFSIGSAGYAQAALERSKVIFSTIANKPSGYDPSNTSLIEAAGNLRFYLIKSGTTTEEALKSSNSSNILFSTSSAKITDLGNGSFAIGWNDGSGSNDFKSLEIKVEGSDDPLAIGTKQQGNSFSGNGGGEVIDLRFTSGLAADTKSVRADFMVNREAAFNNFVGFYKVTDTNGGIDINGDGLVDFTPGQAGYSQAAVQYRVAEIDLAVSNQGSASFTGKTFESNSIFAPFIIVNGNTSSFADSNTSNDPTVYFSYLGANTDGVDHIRLLGSNTFGFEDLAGGGDRDFNDIIVKATLTAVK